MSRKIKKVWGLYKEFAREDDCVMKQLVVEPNQSLSYQFHEYRNEFWYVSSGKGIFTLNGNDFEVSHGDTFNILIKDKHRVRNTGAEQLIIYEMQYGPKCEETDIVRIKDDYGRV